MTQKLVKCPCCEKLVPAEDMELSYRKPDAVACMDQEDIDAQCKYTDDYYACEEKYFYIRGILPLPVLEAGRNYHLGVWVQVSSNSFNKIWDLWDDKNQSNEPPIRALLANDIHLHENTQNIEVEIQLTGPTSRPNVIVKDHESSLYKEQQHGIAIHRASEYSDLCR